MNVAGITKTVYGTDVLPTANADIQYAEYERFTELYVFDNVNNKALSEQYVDTIYYKEGATEHANLTIKAKVGKTNVPTIEMKTLGLTSNITSSSINKYAVTTKSDNTTVTKKNGLGFSQNDGIHNIVIATGDSSKYYVLRLAYEDAVNQKKYMGWVFVKYYFEQKATSV